MPNRRTVLRAAVVHGAAAGAGSLAACGSDAEPAAGASPEETAGGGDGGETPGGETPGGGPTGEVLTPAADVPVGGGVILAGVVVTQPAAGEFRGFSSTCTHQGCTVSSVESGTIHCACHGSAYSAEDGSVSNGPATDPLPEVAVAVDGDNVVRG